ncbi:unnamed protein product [Symbiodinium natans]|uniref:Uncharacterized protein n=1 Tax=Symbiodinium natans TaxID=878477 RepID=A0A812KUE5_9DINO|nr:unnamed protein product [Symbiodinium natans]
MSVAVSTPQEVELPLRSRLSVPEEPREHRHSLIPSHRTLSASSQQPPRPRASRRSVLAETSRDLDNGAAPRHQSHTNLAIAVYTAVRITASVRLLLLQSSACYGACMRGGWCYNAHAEKDYCDSDGAAWCDTYCISEIIGRLCDSIARPLVTGLGLYIFLHRRDRFSAKEPLHTRARFLVFCLASFHCDASVAETLADRHAFQALMLLWEVLCNGVQMQMTNLKLHALGFHITARLCAALMLVILCAMCIGLPFFLFWNDAWKSEMGQLPVLVALACTGATLLLQFCGLCYAAGRSLCLGWHDAAIKAAGVCLCINAALLIPGPLLSIFGGAFFAVNESNAQEDRWSVLLTVDIGLQVLNVLLLSGMVGPQQWARPMEAFQKLAEFQGFGLSTKRIAFPGKVNAAARDCIVSFPGKYSDEWDAAVSAASSQSAFSLACVFLTDRASGLGEHSADPDHPGRCWCHALYGSLPASTYLSVVDVQQLRQEQGNDEASYQQQLSFKKSDAEAMGQLLLIKDLQAELEWQQELSQALNDAEDRCLANHARAPWGCRWFEEWRKNVSKASELGQRLHVFYFEGCKGQGKVAWDQLPDKEVREQVRACSGLGASQTAEVAYLHRLGLSYVEHDITDFKEMMSSNCSPASWPNEQKNRNLSREAS